MTRINSQMIANSLPLSGTSTRNLSLDSETSQSVSFGEILKVEEKKTQPRANTVSIKSMFAKNRLSSLDLELELEPAEVDSPIQTDETASQNSVTEMEVSAELLETQDDESESQDFVNEAESDAELLEAQNEEETQESVSEMDFGENLVDAQLEMQIDENGNQNTVHGMEVGAKHLEAQLEAQTTERGSQNSVHGVDAGTKSFESRGGQNPVREVGTGAKQFEMQNAEGTSQTSFSGVEAGAKPLESQSAERGSQNSFRKMETGMKSFEAQLQMQSDEDGNKNSFDEMEVNAKPFDAQLQMQDDEGEAQNTFSEMDFSASPLDTQSQTQNDDGGSQNAFLEMETDVKPSEAKNNEGGSQNVFREIEAGVNPVETQQQNKEGGSRNSLRELESSAEPFSAEGLGQVIEVQVESEPTAETTVFATEPEKGVGFDAVDESPTGLGKSASIEFIEEIISQVKPHIKNGETSMRLKVNPEDLGAIEIQMVSNERGVTLNFVTEQASTGKLLESQSGQLRQSLKEAGVQLTNLNISQHNQPGQEGGFFRQDRQFVQPNRRSVPLTGPPNEERMRPQRIAGSTHKIDYLV